MAPKGKSVGAGCLILFALPFVLVGLGALGKAAHLFFTGDWKQGVMALMFGVFFSGAGFAVIGLGVFGSKKSKRQASAEAAHPNEPWMWREDWARGEAKSTGKTALLFISFFAFFWNAVSWTILFGFLTERTQQKNMLWLVAIFPSIGVFLLLWALREFLRWRRFGDSIFKMTTVPGVIGGPLAGVIHCRQSLPRAGEVRLRLICIERDSAGENTSENLQWEDEKIFSGEVLQAGAGIPVMFNIPFDCPPTATVSATHEFVWRLEARATTSGTKFQAQFEVPVFKTAASRTDATPLANPAAAYEKPIDRKATPGITIQPAASGGTEFIFAAARNKGNALGLTFFTVIWTGAIVFMIRMKAPIFFPIVFGLFDVLLLAILASVWTSASRVVVDASGIQVAKRWMFVRQQKFLPATEVTSVQIKFSMSHGTTSYYDLQAHVKGGKKVRLAPFVRGKQNAEWLVDEMKKAMRR